MMFSKFISAFFLLFIFSVGQSQTQYKAVPNDENSILVEGTSNIHDWEIQVENFNSEIDLSLKEGIPKSINTFTISIPVKSFNSGKNSMDKNTYKAMEADTYTKISFTSSTKALLNEKSNGVYKAIMKGKLSIAGTTKDLEIPIELHKTSKGYALKSEQNLNMIDFGIEPPTALFGTITTGEEVNTIFNLTYYKQQTTNNKF